MFYTIFQLLKVHGVKEPILFVVIPVWWNQFIKGSDVMNLY